VPYIFQLINTALSVLVLLLGWGWAMFSHFTTREESGELCTGCVCSD